MVRLLLDHDADINGVNGRGQTPLMSAATNNQDEIVKMLLEHGAQVMKQDEDGDTALMRAAVLEHKAVIKLLIQYGGLAQLAIQNNRGQTAFMMTEDQEVLSAFIQR